MIVGVNDTPREPQVLTGAERQSIYDFLQGAVYAWCNTKGTQEFFASTLVGGENGEHWEGTPLWVLNEKYLSRNKTPQQAFEQAGKDIGNLLKNAIMEDKRHFTMQEDARGIKKYALVQ